MRTWHLLVYRTSPGISDPQRKWASRLPTVSAEARWCPAGAASPRSFRLVGRELGSG